MVEAARASLPTSNRDDFRARELGFLEQCFLADHGSVVVLHGRRGVGKGRLADELVRRIAAQPKTACFEGHNPVAGAKSYHPFAEIAQQAMAWADAAGLGDALIDPVYQELALVLERTTSDAEHAPSLDQKLRFFDGFRRLLAGISERTRLLVLVHDLERADNDTLELASYLADELFGDAALDAKHTRTGALVFLVRDDLDEPGAAKSPRARDFLAEALESPTIKALKLEGLDLEGLKSYVQSPRVLEKLLSASRGLPQEIDALIDSLPTNVEELFLRKLAALDAVARTTLEALAISGRPAPARVLAEVGGQPAKAVAQALAELRDARVLERRITSGELQFSFSRRSDLEVTARGVPQDRRAQLHGGWAAALAKESDHHVALLAHHQLRSTEPARGVPLAIQAAEAHAVAGAFDAAVQMLEEARPHASGELLLSILGRLADLAPLTGSPRAALRYVLEWKAALPEAQRGRALLREAELGNAAGDYDRALAALEEARRAVPEASIVERARLEAIASEACYHLGALDRATAAGEAGLARLSTLGADAPARSVVELTNLLGKIALAGDDHARAIALFTETRTRSEAAGLPRELARALVNLGYAYMRRGATRDAETHLVAGIERAKAANDLSHLAFGQMNLGVVLHQRGELGRAIECYRECKSVFRRLGNRTQLARVLHNLANLYLTCGDVARAKGHNDEALRIARASGVERLVAITTALDGLVASELGDQERGEARLREAMVHHRRLGAERPIESMIELAELQLQHGDTSRAESTLREVEGALPTVGNKLLVARAKLLHGRIEHALGDPA
ncbi:tetratricopeptide repeat protein, partial [Myxococcota bacterium]|nr:tetratricopeptide repeat protein [Myxococcota bacterium]